MISRKYVITGIGIAVGAVFGYLYYKYVGCASGTCRITSKPLNSTLYFSLVGGLFFNLFVKDNKTKK